MPLIVTTILALIALVAGIGMLLRGPWGRYPLAAIAIIALALNQLGIIR